MMQRQRSSLSTRASTEKSTNMATQPQRVSPRPCQNALQSTLRNAKYTSTPARMNDTVYFTIFFTEAI